MKIRDVMTSTVIPIAPEENLEVAARTLAHYNIGALPVCGANGRLCGLITDRDIVTRCLASGRLVRETAVRDVMSGSVTCAAPDMEVDEAAKLMANHQIRRLPVLEDGKLCGMVSLGDLAKREKTAEKAANALSCISSNVQRRK